MLRAAFVLEDQDLSLLNDQLENFGHHGMLFIPKGTVKSVWVDSENMAVLNFHTPNSIEFPVSVLGHLRNASYISRDRYEDD